MPKQSDFTQAMNKIPADSDENRKWLKELGPPPLKTPLTHCPECGDETDFDFTPAYNRELPYELVCYQCGWFDEQRYSHRTRLAI